VFSARRVQSAYRAISAAVDRVTGTVMVLFGLRLILSART
jgi:hypothetical protein